jgi:adenylyltransferase/sulfurtransferase
MDRYSKQILFDKIGRIGQEKLMSSKVIIIGCGALGTVIANNLARSGVGYIRLVDRDYIEMTNLQRQVLFDEEDIENNLPKAVAAENKLKKINSDIKIESVIDDVNQRNIVKLCSGMDLIMDGTDNFSTRFLINDVSLKLNIPWIYGGAIGSTGMMRTIIPGETPCFRCIFRTIPPAGSIATCDTAGVLNSITNVIASFQSAEAIKLLTGQRNELVKGMRYIDVWSGDYEILDIKPDVHCPACRGNGYEFLNSQVEDAVYLCGKDSVQVNPINTGTSAEQILGRLEAMGVPVRKNRFYLKFTVEEVQFTLFYDGRAILKNVSDTSRAKTLYSKYIGQ